MTHDLREALREAIKETRGVVGEWKKHDRGRTNILLICDAAEAALIPLPAPDAGWRDRQGEDSPYLKWWSCGKCDNRWRCYALGKVCADTPAPPVGGSSLA